MKEGMKFGVGCRVGFILGETMLTILDHKLNSAAEKCDEKGGEEES